MRLGIANLPIMLAIMHFSFQEIIILTFFKVLLQGIISGTLFSYIAVFSLAGSFASTFSVYIFYSVLKKIRAENHVSFIGLCMLGSVASNLAQLACSKFIAFGQNTRFIAPVLLANGFFTGLALGIFMLVCQSKSVFFNYFLKSDMTGSYISQIQADNVLQSESSAKKTKDKNLKNIFKRFSAICILLLAFALPFFKNFKFVLTVTFCLLGCAEILRKGKVRLLPSFIIFVTFTLLSLLSPIGRIIISFGPVRLTQDSLIRSLTKACDLCAMVFASQSFFVLWQIKRSYPAKKSQNSADDSCSTRTNSIATIVETVKAFTEISSQIKKDKSNAQKSGFLIKFDEKLLEFYENLFEKHSHLI